MEEKMAYKGQLESCPNNNWANTLRNCNYV